VKCIDSTERSAKAKTVITIPSAVSQTMNWREYPVGGSKMALTYRGVRFQGYNKPKRTPSHKTKSHAVVAKVGNKVRLIRFGQQGVTGAGKKPKTVAQKARRKSFKARHAKNIAKGKMSAAYWANKVKW
jgi:hypothetical protein